MAEEDATEEADSEAEEAQQGIAGADERLRENWFCSFSEAKPQALIAAKAEKSPQPSATRVRVEPAGVEREGDKYQEQPRRGPAPEQKGKRTRISAEAVQQRLADIQAKFGLSSQRDAEPEAQPGQRGWKPSKQLRLEGLIKEEPRAAKSRSLNYSVEPKKFGAAHKSGERSEHFDQRKPSGKTPGPRNKSLAEAAQLRGGAEPKQPRKAAKKTLRNYFKRLSKMKSARHTQRWPKKGGKAEAPRTPETGRKKRLKGCAMNIRSMDMEFSPAARRFCELGAGKQNTSENCFSSKNELRAGKTRGAKIRKWAQDPGAESISGIAEGEEESEGESARREQSEPKRGGKKAARQARKKAGAKEAARTGRRRKFCFKQYFKTSVGDSLRLMAGPERTRRKPKKPRKLQLLELKLRRGDLASKTNSAAQTSKGRGPAVLESARGKKRRLLIEVDAPDSAASRKSRKYVVRELLEKKGFCVNLFDPRGKSAKRVVSQVRSSVVDGDPGKTRPRARLRRNRRTGKKGARGEKARGGRLQVLNLDLRGKDFWRLASPRLKQSFKKHRRDENRRAKKGASAVKKRTLKVSAKNLMSKFNKVSYFQYKKTRAQPQTNCKRTAEPAPRGPRAKWGLRNFSVNKRNARRMFNHSLEKAGASRRARKFDFAGHESYFEKSRAALAN